MSEPDDERPIRVGIGLISRGGRYLVRQRPAGQIMAGYWEFPGGKCEPGESGHEAAARECLEEVGVPVVLGPLMRRILHRYPHGLVELEYYEGVLEADNAGPAADSGFVWVEASDLPGLRFPGANEPIIAELARTRP